MKNFFNVIVIALSLLTAYLIFYIYMGNPNNFNDPDIKHEPKPGNVPGMIYTGGPLVGLLMSFVLIAITFIFERAYSIGQAKGKGNPAVFIKSVITKLTQGDLDGAVAECDKQRGSMANVLRSAIVRFQEIEHDPEFPGEKKVSEVQRAIDESMNLETPLLEKNLVILSTIASVAVLVGLLGTTLGMIRAFQALAISGTVSAIQLSIGISEALYNTAGGLVGAIIAIVAYNYFTTKVDNFVYMIDEAILNITQIFTVRIKS
ncbi:MAG: MotA/TolQ/ExbB proton channel family protein [Candidatus Kapabacteria bacterium]|nr:MotA/TolQ/ExbB proton channel family protein [Candidatus Kapabacteria bacterium]